MGTMRFESLVERARSAGASDLHLEPGLPAAVRVRGELQLLGDPLGRDELLGAVKQLLEGDAWPAFLERRSADLARTLGGGRCRINVFCTARGVGMAIRFLAPFQTTLERLNLHPELRTIARAAHGLVIVSGPTGSGKSSTLAALIEEVNRSERRHVVTIESPIEYTLVPRQAFIRQREVGRDTPSFEQALHDALREDADLLMVGEVRDPETMRLTLSAAETGHLVLTSLHSATVGEALARIVAAFPSEIQSGICAQLADSLVAVICQRLRWWPGPGLRAPECEVLRATTQVRAMVRAGHFFKLSTALETGRDDGCWTFDRYRSWMEARTDWNQPSAPSAAPVSEVSEERPLAPAQGRARQEPPRAPAAARPRPQRPSAPDEPARDDGVVSIDEADEDLDGIIAELDRK